jgi:hypothetical protein
MRSGPTDGLRGGLAADQLATATNPPITVTELIEMRETRQRQLAPTCVVPAADLIATVHTSECRPESQPTRLMEPDPLNKADALPLAALFRSRPEGASGAPPTGRPPAPQQIPSVRGTATVTASRAGERSGRPSNSATIVDGRYLLLERIGSGGTAAVYRAEDLVLGRIVALKLLHGCFADDEEVVERFRREASRSADLRDAHIVAVYDRGTGTAPITSRWNTFQGAHSSR